MTRAGIKYSGIAHTVSVPALTEWKPLLGGGNVGLAVAAAML